MNDTHKKLVEKLIYDTRKANINWISLFDLTEAEDLSNVLPGFIYIFWDDEWHKTDYTSTFISFNKDFIAVATTETVDSGSDYAVNVNGSTKFVDHNLYISRTKSSKPFQLSLSNDDVSKLIETIKESIYFPSELEGIINNYLNS